MARLDNLLKYAASMGASDLHIVAGSAPLVRKHGELRPLKANTMSPQETLSLIGEILNTQQREFFTKNLDLDFCYETSGIGRFRTNVLKQRNGVDAVFRIIPDRIPTLEELGFPQTVHQLLENHQGLILVTGPAGCGKSTTLAAMIDWINSRKKYHIITVEDPIEYVHANKKAQVIQREVKRHTETFSTALRAALR
ncbi:MAG TPA: ATPase, T2SS/T4P/T4SS family, partial [Acidobacteriota bacterium]|nr:ATPase, T2SS/T4P/T4SS family [Acidobacteriota bacterium]